jgi:RHH-type transcriptional regulator, rel operon repressor / antitoxin RelB
MYYIIVIQGGFMAISLRLNSSLERELNKHAHLLGVPKSEFIRNLISDFLKKKSKRLSPWELGEKVFGREGSGLGNLSIDRKAILKEKLHAKKNHH